MKRLTVSKVRNLNFGRHIERSFDGLDSRFVVIHGANESGKSTLAEFLTWAIGGPWRSFAKNSDIFRIKSGDAVYGDVSATLEDDPLEFEARFTLPRRRGLPGDKRKGVLAGRDQDALGIGNSLGGISAEDYSLIYRLYGGSLSEIGSGVEFSNLFSSFAMGSTHAMINPRQALDHIEETCKRLATSKREGNEKLKVIESKIKEATRAPEEIAKLKATIQELLESIDSLKECAEQLVAERNDLTRLISGQLHINEKKLAESEIQALPTNSKAIQIVAENLSDLEQLTEEKRLAERAARDSRKIAEIAIAECGLTESAIKDRTFSPLERVEVAGAARTLSEAAARRSNSDLAARNTEGALRGKQAEIERECRQIGLEEGQLTYLDSISIDLPSLSELAGRWVEQVNAAIEDEGKLAAIRKIPTLGVTQGGQRGLPRAGLAAGFVLVALASFAHPFAGFAVAAVLAAFALFFRTRNLQEKLKATGEPNIGSGAEIMARDAQEHREQAKSHRARLLKGLGPLADLIEEADTSRARISLLATVAEMRRQLKKLSEDLDAAQSEVAGAASALVTAEHNAKKVLGARDIPLSLVDQHFETWLARYEQAISKLSSSASAQRHVDQLQKKITSLLTPITGEITGLELKAVIERVRNAHEVEEQRKTALQRIRDAKLAISAANLDSPGAKTLLDKYDDESKLRGRLEFVLSEAKTTADERDRDLATHARLEAELQQRSGIEVLPGLNLEKGSCEEAIEENDLKLAAANVAEKVLRETIDRYERENQDPVVAAASALINKIVPDWGSVMFSRDKDGNPVLERRDNDDRLNEKMLSDGARALLYLGIRLAFAQKDAERRGIALPLICDDPLLYFDDKRSLSALRLLADFSKTHQVILFTPETSTRDAAAKLGASIVEI